MVLWTSENINYYINKFIVLINVFKAGSYFATILICTGMKLQFYSIKQNATFSM